MIEVICVTYGQDWSLKCLINSFKSQVNNNWFLRVIHDGIGKNFDSLQEDLFSNNYLCDQVSLEATPERFNDFGHSLRNYGLKNPTKDSDFILITNGDNYYLPTFIDNIIDVYNSKPESKFIFTDYIQKLDHTIHDIPKDRFFLMNNKIAMGTIDMGSAVISTEIARKVGFNDKSYYGDFHYFKDCLDHIDPNSQIFKIPQPLFVHI